MTFAYWIGDRRYVVPITAYTVPENVELVQDDRPLRVRRAGRKGK